MLDSVHRKHLRGNVAFGVSGVFASAAGETQELGQGCQVFGQEAGN